MSKRCAYVFESSGHQCADDTGHDRPCFATPTGESVEEYSTMSAAEALWNPYTEKAVSAVSLDDSDEAVLEELLRWVRYVGEPPGHLQPATEVFVSPKLNAEFDRRGLMLRLLEAVPAFVNVHVVRELEGPPAPSPRDGGGIAPRPGTLDVAPTTGMWGIMFSSKSPVDIRMAIVLLFPRPAPHA